jgi:hypothetical protein
MGQHHYRIDQPYGEETDNSEKKIKGTKHKKKSGGSKKTRNRTDQKHKKTGCKKEKKKSGGKQKKYKGIRRAMTLITGRRAESIDKQRARMKTKWAKKAATTWVPET